MPDLSKLFTLAMLTGGFRRTGPETAGRFAEPRASFMHCARRQECRLAHVGRTIA